MTKYFSKKPTREKLELFSFMEKHKKSGTVAPKRLGRYIMGKGYKVRGGKRGYFEVLTKKDSLLMTGGIGRKRERITMWAVR